MPTRLDIDNRHIQNDSFTIYTNRGDSVAGGLFRRRGAAGMQRLPQFAEFANFWNEWKSLNQICCLNYILFASITITLHQFWDISSEMHQSMFAEIRLVFSDADTFCNFVTICLLVWSCLFLWWVLRGCDADNPNLGNVSGNCSDKK